MLKSNGETAFAIIQIPSKTAKHRQRRRGKSFFFSYIFFNNISNPLKLIKGTERPGFLYKLREYHSRFRSRLIKVQRGTKECGCFCMLSKLNCQMFTHLSVAGIRHTNLQILYLSLSITETRMSLVH